MLCTSQRLFWWAYWLLVCLLFLAALLVVVARYTLPQVGAFREELQQLLSEQLGRELQIGEIEGYWQGSYPTIELRDLRLVRQPDEPLTLSVHRLQVGLDVGRSLLGGRPVFSRLTVSEPYIGWQSGQPAVEAPASTAVTLPEIPLWLLDQPLTIEQGAVALLRPGQPTIQLQKLQAGLQAEGQRYQLRLTADLVVGEQRHRVQISARGQGDPTRQPVQLFAELDGLPTALLNPYLPENQQLKALSLNQRIWATLQGGQLERLQAQTDIAELQLGDQLMFSDSRLSATLLKRPQGYQLQLHDSRLTQGDKTLHLPALSFNLVPAAPTGWRLAQLQLAALALDPITDWLREQPWLGDIGQQALTSLRPRGVLRNLQVDWPGRDPAGFQLQADLDQLAVDDWDGVPQLLGIDGRLTADAMGGAIHLGSQNFVMNFPDLFPDGWQYQQADGIIRWRLDEQAVVVNSGLLHLEQQDIEAEGRFSIRLPYSRDQQTELTLMIGTRSADGRVTGRYVPPAEVGEDLHRWLVEAIRAGSVNQGGFLLHGGTRSRLDDHQRPTVQMFFDVQQAEFAYQPGWPAITDGRLFMLLKDGALLVDVDRARLLDSKIDYARVYLPPGESRLQISGRLQGDAGDIHRLLLESPLRAEVGDELANWQLTGPVVTEVALAIPLEGGRPDLHLGSQIRDGRFHSERQRLDFSKINGLVRYDSPHGLHAKDLKAQLFGRPASAQISSGPAEAFGNVPRTRIRLDSRIDMATLRDWLQLPLLKIANGETWYRAQLDLCAASQPKCTGLTVRSALQGVSVEAPVPLAKQADSETAFSLRSNLAAGKERFDIRYGEQLRALLLMRDGTLERGLLGFNQADINLPARPGLVVEGELAQLDYDQLMQFLDKAELLQGGGQADAEPLLRSVALKLGSFSLDDFALGGLAAALRPVDEGWNLSVDSEKLAGSILFPANERPYEVDIRHLKLQRDSASDDSSQASTPSPIDPNQLPASNVRLQALELNGKPMGSWSFALLPDERGATVRDLKGDLHGIVLNGEIRWDDGDSHRSALTLKLNGGDLGNVLAAWGHGRAMENEELVSYLQLEWPGAPWQYRMAAADGTVEFVAKQGRIVESGTSSNFLRLFGILNLNSIGRRLRLDFSDLFEKGVAFDRMAASYEIRQGVAETVEPFKMTGPSMDMTLIGKLDLANETIDQDMEVTLPVTSNLPIMGVLLGQPHVAGAVFLIDKLIGDKLQKFTTIRYHLAGDWGDPTIELYKEKPSESAQPAMPAGDR
ncbi:YhdP family protein [Marinobacterium arenosum]|uniref:YhdP family protein n=1 Tax=Marinobacterium arenosum TaxID=2862496 RepID=UPI001C96B9CB|nr:YhdP family protein [Marinobacterium arenosum]MBY4676752.1 TIGR02099 family protein [Marinobacterium arenosum]